MTCKTTHYMACDCREKKFQKLVKAVKYFKLHQDDEHRGQALRAMWKALKELEDEK